MKFEVHTLPDLEPVCREIQRLCDEFSVFALYGNLSSGKTTLVQAICRHLGIRDHVLSPTYSIINEYVRDGEPVYHIDLYRLKSEAEALQAGVEECLFSGKLCFVEWPDHFENLLPGAHVKIFLRKLENENRTIEVVSSLQ